MSSGSLGGDGRYICCSFLLRVKLEKEEAADTTGGTELNVDSGHSPDFCYKALPTHILISLLESLVFV